MKKGVEMKKLIVGIGIILAASSMGIPARASDLYWRCCLYGNPGCCWLAFREWWWG